MLIDSHCHLHLIDLKDRTIHQVLGDAKEKGIEKLISVATKIKDIDKIKEITAQFDNIYYSVGTHPGESENFQPDLTERILSYVNDDIRCIAVGEIGLDYYAENHQSPTIQKNKFEMQISAAIETKKPIIVHTRSAKEDTLSILKNHSVDQCGGVIHCFTEDWDMAKRIIDLGMYLSFSGIVTFKNAQDIQAIAKKVPLDRILVETDAPYLAPAPFRGKPNYPSYLYYVAQFISQLRKEDFEYFCRATKENTQKLFSLV